jgi:GNAT superfamily N-acetyltransferase
MGVAFRCRGVRIAFYVGCLGVRRAICLAGLAKTVASRRADAARGEMASVAGRSGIDIGRLGSRKEFEEFARFPFTVYRESEAWWPPDARREVELLEGRSPLSSYLEIAPFCARREGAMVARVSAIVNHRYNEQWNEKLGHLIHFEALADEKESVTAMLDAAAQWLRGRGMTAARSGFAAFLDYPYAIDNYGALPSFLMRANPPYYHCYLKNAGFETEKGQVDYSAALVPELLARYRALIDDAARSGVRVLSWREFGFVAAVDAWADVINAAFARHWGWNSVTRAEVRPMLLGLCGTPVAELSMIAVEGGDCVGAVFSVPDVSASLAAIRRGTRLGRGALINIGVLERARRRGVARATAARSFLEMARLGMRQTGYTLVLDDNWPSRRTAESLGAHVTGNFVSYRREFFRRTSEVNGAPSAAKAR